MSMACPIEISHAGVTLNPLSLFALLTTITTSTHEHDLVFQHEDSEFQIAFFPSLSVITPDAMNKRSGQNSSFCHFRGDNDRGYRAWLSACEPDRIEMILKARHGSFRLEQANGTFALFSDDNVSCDVLWRALSKREGIFIQSTEYRDQTLPAYYEKYNHLFSRRRYVEFVMLGDHTLFERYGNDMEKTKNRMLTILHFTNSLFDSLNIEFQLVHLKVFESADILNLDYTTDKTFWSTYSDYIEKEWSSKYVNGAHYDSVNMITGKYFTNGGSAVGTAYLWHICYPKGSMSWIYDGDQTDLGMHKLAHELGHSFGMYHDKNDDYEVCECATKNCIMGAYDQDVPAQQWSNCSLDYLDKMYKTGSDYCLWNKPGETLESPSCGNGVVDVGEDCDCGLWGCLTHDCCDTNTCKFRENAQCASGSCCDLATCSVNRNGSLCREAKTTCDLPEFCDGENLECPADSAVGDGEPCPDDPEAFCYHGRCGSRILQCKELYGADAQPSSEDCYKSNFGLIGCGRVTETSNMACAEEDILCGKLYCDNPSETLLNGRGWDHLAYGSNGRCLVAHFKSPDGYDLEYLPGMTVDGAKCGDGKYCRNAKCVSKAELFGTPISVQTTTLSVETTTHKYITKICNLSAFYDEHKCEDRLECAKPSQSDDDLICENGFGLQAQIPSGNELGWIDVLFALCLGDVAVAAFEGETRIERSKLAVGFRCVRAKIEQIIAVN